MAPVSVGTAFVSIRAITSQIGSDIERGLKDIDTESIGKKLGQDIGRHISAGIGAGLDKDLETEIGDATDDAAESSTVRRSIDNASKEWVSRFFSGFGNLWGKLFKRETGDIKTDSMENAAEQIGSNFSARLIKSFADGKGGADFTKSVQGFFDNFDKRIHMPGGLWGWAALLGLPLLQGAVSGAISVLGGLTAALGYLVTAAAGAGVALLGLAATVAPIGLALFAVFKTPGPLLDDFKKRMAELSEPFLEIGRNIQRVLFPALENALTALQAFLDPLTDYGVLIGDVLASTVDHAAAILTSEDAMASFNKVLDESVLVGGNLSEAFGFFLEALIPILEAAAPLATKLTESLANMMESFRDFVEAKGAEGLSETFDLWYKRLSVVMSILGDVAIGLWNIFSLGGDAAAPFFKSLEDGAERFPSLDRRRRC